MRLVWRLRLGRLGCWRIVWFDKDDGVGVVGNGRFSKHCEFCILLIKKTHVI